MSLEQTLDEHSFDNRFAMDNKLYVVFSVKAIKNEGKSDREGRPIFDDVPHIRIHVPGDKNSIAERPVTDEDKVRFASRWEKFQKNMEQSPEGTPLEMWPQLSISQVYEFKALGVMTVEQLAAMSDSHAAKFMGGHEIRRRADVFIKLAKDTAEAQRVAVLNDELTTRLAAQDEQLRQMAAKLEALTDERRGQKEKGSITGAIGKALMGN